VGNLVDKARILVVGGGIGGLTAAIALRQRGFQVDLIERQPEFAVYGVGIIQQANVIRAVAALGILDDYIDAGFGFDHVSVFAPNGIRVARLTTPRLLEGYPSNVGISRRALHKVLVDTARAAGAHIQLGTTAVRLEDTGTAVRATLSSGASAAYDLVIGADGLNSSTRDMIFPDAAAPEFTGQGVWRYNFKRTADVDGIHSYHGQIGVGLCPLADDLMYMFATTPEPGNPEYPRLGIAKTMRDKLTDCPAAIQQFAAAITEDEGVVYRPLEWLFLTGAWHRGRIVLLGDAVHSTTPHLGQGAGLAIEDSLVLADELSKAATPEQAFQAYRERRHERCRYIVEKSKSLCYSQLGKGPHVDQAEATQEMFGVIAHPI
jgi:2-polyprenyl-6-methoxyphenol hydroxylase-like FAD-dependent oxidoreductase